MGSVSEVACVNYQRLTEGRASGWSCKTSGHGECSLGNIAPLPWEVQGGRLSSNECEDRSGSGEFGEHCRRVKERR